MQIPDFSRARVLVVGDVMLDRFWRGPCGRVSQEAPVPIVKVEATEDRPGGAANVAINIASLGGAAHLVGVTGDDEAGECLRSSLTARGVTHDLIAVDGARTVTKLRVLSQNQQLIRLDFEDGFQALDDSSVKQHLQRRLANSDVVVVSDYAKGALGDAGALIDAARGAGRPVLVDPIGSDFRRYRGATLLKPNLNEFQAVAGHCPDNATLEARSRAMLEELDIEALLITRGEQGVALIRREQPMFELTTAAREVFDVTGAGDTVIATVAAALAADASMEQSTRLANEAAGLVVGKLGTAAVTAAELGRVFDDGEAGATIVDDKALQQRVAAARARGERIVFTNGCFDLLHAGHVSCLQHAKRLGDRLIVAVNDDASAGRLKGPGRPVNELSDRARVLAGLAAVDWVVAFGEDTPQRLVRELLPDVLVKGGDYQPAEIVGADIVRDAGGEVVIIDYVEGQSTSSIIDRAAQGARSPTKN